VLGTLNFVVAGAFVWNGRSANLRIRLFADFCQDAEDILVLTDMSISADVPVLFGIVVD